MYGRSLPKRSRGEAAPIGAGDDDMRNCAITEKWCLVRKLFAADPERVVGGAGEAGGALVDAEGGASGVERQCGVDQPAGVGELIGVTGQEDLAAVADWLSGNAVDVREQVRGAIVQDRAIELGALPQPVAALQ